MPSIDINYFASQFDGDTMWYYKDGVKKSGTCVETCLKMIDNYLTVRQNAIINIVKNGDNNPKTTTFEGAVKSAKWLGFPLFQHKPIAISQIKEFLDYGHLLIAIIDYSKMPIKGMNYNGVHAILITGIDDNNNSIRYADPIYSGASREEGWMNNKKWISWKNLDPAWKVTGYTCWEVQKSKPVTTPTPPVQTCEQKLKQTQTELTAWRNKYDNLKKKIQDILNKS